MFTCDFNANECSQYLTPVNPAGSLAEFFWTRRQGSTPSFGTGPNTDRSGFGECCCLRTTEVVFVRGNSAILPSPKFALIETISAGVFLSFPLVAVCRVCNQDEVAPLTTVTLTLRPDVADARDRVLPVLQGTTCTRSRLGVASGITRS